MKRAFSESRFVRTATAWTVLASHLCSVTVFAATVKPAAGASALTKIYGKVPGEYVGQKSAYATAEITIKGREITAVEAIRATDIPTKAGKGEIVLKDSDVLYPGLFNLHNHTKQNVLGVWGDAHGQFQNRFEWRGWSKYSNAVSANMNPWIGLGAAVSCAAFRYSELQAMALGTTYLQGPSSCVKGFAINRVEDADSFLNRQKLSAVAAPTDLIYPNEMVFVWKHVRPAMMKAAGVKTFDALLDKLEKEPDSKVFSYEAGLQDVIQARCPGLVKKYPVLADKDPYVAMDSTEAVKVLGVSSNFDTKKGLCEASGTDEASIADDAKMRRYVYFIHPSIAGKKNAVKDPKKFSSIIAHLAEGRRLDPYNQLEFSLLRLLGLDRANVNLIHGVGVDAEGFKHMAKRGMGLIWSPFSNHLLYKETVDVAAAVKAGVNIALGSDWTPTGSRSTLEEVKMARKYLQMAGNRSIFGSEAKMDEALYRMMTSNAAKMVNHEGEAGTIAAGAAASLIVASITDKSDPYKNLVLETDESKINLVIVDGKPVYGNLSYIEETEANGITPKPAGGEYEDLGLYFADLNSVNPKAIWDDHKEMNARMKAIVAAGSGDEDDQDDDEASAAKEADKPSAVSKEEKEKYLFDAAKLVEKTTKKVASEKQPEDSKCSFTVADRKAAGERKVFVPTDSMSANAPVAAFHKATGMSLDTIHDIVILLQGSLMTHSRNAYPEATPYKAAQFQPVYSCQDAAYLKRIGGDGKDADKLFATYIAKEIEGEKRVRSKELGASPDPENKAKAYGLEFEIR